MHLTNINLKAEPAGVSSTISKEVERQEGHLEPE